MLDELNNRIEILDKEIVLAKKQVEILREFKRIAIRQKQAICNHDNTYTVDVLDYHNNVDWTETHCKDCGKYLSRY